MRKSGTVTAEPEVEAIDRAPIGQVIMEVKGITKRFPGVLANDQVEFSLRKGEIHAVLGENGAGKTTLMNILYGLHQPDDGTIVIAGRPVVIRSPQHAMRLGIGMVHQHFKLFETLTVAENIFYGLDAGGRLYLNQKRLEEKAELLLSQCGLKMNPKMFVWQLPVGIRQKVELAKILCRGAKILILDEPTAVLTPQEARELFDVLRAMVAAGHSVIFITHKLDEVLAVSNRITVLRHGRVVSTIEREGTDKVTLARMMVSREVLFRIEHAPAIKGEIGLEVRDLWVNGDLELPVVRGCSFEVAKGEILAVAGVAGNGQRELVEAVTGLRKVKNGTVKVVGNDVTNKSPRQLLQAGLGVIPEDRRKHGLILDFSIEENMILNKCFYAPYVRWGFLQRREIEKQARELAVHYAVQAPSVKTVAGTLSGGNLQKVVLARELSRHCDVLIVSEPTRGLDIAASEYVRRKMLEQREKGTAILLVSSDLDEVFSISDRIAVLFEGQVVGVLETAKAELEMVGLLMGGARRG